MGAVRGYVGSQEGLRYQATRDALTGLDSCGHQTLGQSADRGKRGRVLRIVPEKNRLIVEGVAVAERAPVAALWHCRGGR